MTLPSTALAYVLAYMTMTAPPLSRIPFPDAKETEEQRQTRFAEVAQDIVSVAFDEQEPSLYPAEGEMGRAHTALAMIAIVRYESNFRLDIDKGLGPFGLGDNGRSFCSMQVMVGSGKTTPWHKTKHRWVLAGDKSEDLVSWNGRALLRNRQNCFRAGLHAMKVSYGACGGHVASRFRVYASGSCSRSLSLSVQRSRHIENWWGSHAFPSEKTAFLEK